MDVLAVEGGTTVAFIRTSWVTAAPAFSASSALPDAVQPTRARPMISFMISLVPP